MFKIICFSCFLLWFAWDEFNQHCLPVHFPVGCANRSLATHYANSLGATISNPTKSMGCFTKLCKELWQDFKTCLDNRTWKHDTKWFTFLISGLLNGKSISCKWNTSLSMSGEMVLFISFPISWVLSKWPDKVCFVHLLLNSASLGSLEKNVLIHWGQDKMTAFSSAFDWMKMYEYHLRFHWNLILSVQLTVSRHWFR